MRILLIFFLILLLGGCNTQILVEKEIKKANYCEVKSDCVIIESECPFGCYIGINKNEEDKIRGLIEDYNSNKLNSKCVYSCIQIQGIDCINSKCEIIK